jgi:hypothetical protein
MPRTLQRQDAQVDSTLQTSVGFVDNTPPAATMESGAASLAQDLNNIRSLLSYFNDLQTGNWYDPFTAPPVFPSEGSIRGIQTISDALHALERKRVLITVSNLSDVVVPVAQNYAVLTLGQLPVSTTQAVGTVTTLGTVAAFNAGFGSHSMASVPSLTAILPKNLCAVVDGSTRKAVLSSGRVIFALFQVENATDGIVMTGTTPNRAQLSFVRLTDTGDGLEAVPFEDIAARTINYASVERMALEDLDEDFLRDSMLGATTASVSDQKVPFSYSTASPLLLQQVFPGQVLERCTILVTTPFDDPAASVTLGTTTVPTLVFAPGDTTLDVLGNSYDQSSLFDLPIVDFFQLTISPAASTQGAGLLLYKMR